MHPTNFSLSVFQQLQCSQQAEQNCLIRNIYYPGAKMTDKNWDEDIHMLPEGHGNGTESKAKADKDEDETENKLKKKHPEKKLL